ncbi:MAG: hypothetical protein GTO18_09020 [Anaerolineales bacterium]|nr:hypothetical protein [Anaerolineales bacterium]
MGVIKTLRSKSNRLVCYACFLFIVVMVTFIPGCQQAASVTPSPLQTQIPPSPVPERSPTLSPYVSATPSQFPTPVPREGPQLDINGESSNSYLIPLHAQHVTEGTVVLVFELETAEGGYLFYWSPVAADIQETAVPLKSDAVLHEITIQGLTPSTEYHFAIGLGEDIGPYVPPSFLGESWDPIRIRTLGVDQWPLRIGVFGDSGFGGSTTQALADTMATYDLDFVLHTGDLVYHIHENADPAEAFALKYFDTLGSLQHRSVIYPIPGNHDYDPDAFWTGKPYYDKVFNPIHDTRFPGDNLSGGRHWYALAYGPIQFVMLDTQAFYGLEGRSEQNAWLKDRLEDDRFTVTIPIFHVPPYTSGLHGNDGRAVQSDWIPLFENGRVSLVLSGHDHNYERLKVQGITYIVSGGGSSVLYDMSVQLEGSQFFAARTHFSLLEVYPDHIDVSAITLDGETIDQATVDFIRD